MAIYTRTGDDGTTGLYGGKRVSKSCVQVEAYGALDELTVVLGMFTSYLDDKEEYLFIRNIQRDLYLIMGFLANAPVNLTEQKKNIVVFEKKIDTLTEKLPPLNDFILPGGSIASSWAHLARVSCRRAERIMIAHLRAEGTLDVGNSIIILTYLNRLSDLLFTYARTYTKERDLISKKI